VQRKTLPSWDATLKSGADVVVSTSLEPAVFPGADKGLYPAGHAQFAQDGGDVIVDRTLAQVHLFGDLGGGTHAIDHP